MKKSGLVKEIRNAAKAQGLSFDLDRQGASHEIWICGDTKVPMPRHTEITATTERLIRKQLEDALGKDWWR